MTLNLAYRSPKVDFGRPTKRKTLFRYPSPITAKISGVFPLEKVLYVGSTDSEDPKLTNDEIIFEEFQSM